jgi:hypothetical protein
MYGRLVGVSQYEISNKYVEDKIAKIVLLKQGHTTLDRSYQRDDSPYPSVFENAYKTVKHFAIGNIPYIEFIYQE